MNIEELYRIFLECGNISTDTRHISKGDLFFALKGENFDGNKFAEQALDKGAFYAVIDDPGIQLEDERLIPMEDSLVCLQELARYHRSQLDIPLFAITGSNGKTTTKELVAAVLGRKYKLAYSKGNLNNHIGVPLTILGIDTEDELAVVEMGANHKGEIDLLCNIARPSHGMITNIGHAHLDGFGGFEGVVIAKSELYNYIKHNGGHLFVNGDDKLLIELSINTVRTIYGGNSQLKGTISASAPYIHVNWFSGKTGPHTVKTKLFGTYNLDNIMAAICSGLYFGVEPEDINAAIESYRPDNNRSQFFDSGKNLLIKDAYNANPSSMLAALGDFYHMESANKMLILGDMFELGEASYKEHLNILDKIKEMGFEKALLIGPEFLKTCVYSPFMHLSSRKEAAKWISDNKIEGYTILIKGSRGMALEELYTLL